ncbi:MAG: hypothetical protein JXA90_07955 [Planctomycetes bacterium]|nr:hypothetical protein [Planctomycetota bacterium]
MASEPAPLARAPAKPGRGAVRGWLASLLVATAAAAQPQAPPEDASGAGPRLEVATVIFPERIARDLGQRGGWLPVYLEIRSRGDRPEPVTIEGRVDPGRDMGHPFVTRRRLEVAPGPAPRRAWMYLMAAPDVEAQAATLTVTSRGQIVRTGDEWVINSFEHAQYRTPRILVVGGEPTEPTPWSGVVVPEGLEAEVTSEAFARLEAHQLPDRAIGYHAVDLVVIRDDIDARLEPAQKEALLWWVHLGGFAVLVPGARGASFFEGELVRDLLGSAAGQARIEHGFLPANLFYRDASLPGGGISARVRRGADTPLPHMSRSGLQAAADGTRRLEPYEAKEGLRLSPRTTYTIVDPFSMRDDLLREIRSSEREAIPVLDRGPAAGTMLYGEVRCGSGRVGVLTLDDQTYGFRESLALRNALWRQIVLPAVTGGGGGRWSSAGARLVQEPLAQALQDTKRDVGTFLIGTMVVIYLLVVGPGIYFFLRRRNRLPAIIWVEPLVIALSVGAIFLTGYLTKGLRTKVRTFTLLHQRRDSPLLFRESYLSIFSADDAEYSIEAPRGELLQPIFSNPEEAQPLVLERTDRAEGGSLEPLEKGGGDRLRISGFRLRLWQHGYAVNVGLERAAGMIHAEPLDAAAPQAGGKAPESRPQPGRFAVTNGLPLRVKRFVLHTAAGPVAIDQPIASGETVHVDLSRSRVLEASTALERARRADGTSLEEETATVLSRLRTSGLGPAGRILIEAHLERPVEDFRLAQPSSLAQREDLYLLYE